MSLEKDGVNASLGQAPGSDAVQQDEAGTAPLQRYETAPVLITGMSGAGLSSAARVLEDMGWYVAHNLPPELIIGLLELCAQDESPVEKVAVVTDVRARMFEGTMMETVQELRERGLEPTLLFIEARDDVLIKRFDSVRRTHPLQGGDTLQIGLDRERSSLGPVKEAADIVVDTSELSIHDLRRAIESSFESLGTHRQHVTVQSFGFKHGAPQDSDIVLDARFLPNPFWIPKLRPFRGTDAAVAEYVLSQQGAQPFVDDIVSMISTMRAGYRHEGKNFITVSVGCTGGHHRSVAISEELARRLREQDDLDVNVVHRDLQRD